MSLKKASIYVKINKIIACLREEGNECGAKLAEEKQMQISVRYVEKKQNRKSL